MGSIELLSIIVPAILTFGVGVVGAFTARNTVQVKAMYKTIRAQQETIDGLQQENRRLRERLEDLELENSKLRERLNRKNGKKDDGGDW